MLNNRTNKLQLPWSCIEVIHPLCPELVMYQSGHNPSEKNNYQKLTTWTVCKLCCY